MIDFAQAGLDGNGDVMRDSVVMSNPVEKRACEAWIAATLATAELDKRVTAKFGIEQANAALGDRAAELKGMKESILKGSETITGDDAIVTPDEAGQSGQHLRKIDGRWKIVLAREETQVPPGEAEIVFKMQADSNAILKQAAADVDAGKYPSAAAVKADLDKKVADLEAKAVEAIRKLPTTKPSTTRPM